VTDADLAVAILSDTTATAFAESYNDAGCATYMTTALPPVVVPIQLPDLNIWASSRGVLSAVINGTTNTNSQIASACLGVEAAIRGGAQILDLTNPTIAGPEGLLMLLTSAGILPANVAASGSAPTPGSSGDLLAYSSAPQIITTTQVSRCLIPHRTGA
jgi:hypothetical protein